MIISQEQFLKAGKPKLVTPATSNPGIPEKPQKEGFFTRVSKDLIKRGSAIKETVKKAGDGKLDPGQAGLQIAGQVAGGVGDVVAQGATSAFRALPDKIEQPIRKAGVKVLQTPLGQIGLQAIEKGHEAYQAFKTTHPDIAADLESVVNIAALLPIGKGAEVTTKGAMNATKAVGKTAARAGESVADFAGAAKNKALSLQETLSGIDTPTKAVLDPALNAERAIQAQSAKGLISKEIAQEKITQIGSSVKEQAISIKQKADDYLKQAKRAAIDYTQPTPLEFAGKKAEEALTSLNNKLSGYGKSKQKALEAVANQKIAGIDSVKIRLLEGLDKKVGAYIDEAGNIVNAHGKVSKIALDPADQKLLKDTYNLIHNLDDSDTVLRVDGTIDALQDLLYKRNANIAQPVNGTVEGLLKEITGELNGMVKSTVGSKYIQANSKYANVIELRDKLNKALGIDASKGGALMKRVFSPSDGGTKQLFNKIKEITGIDLTNEAVLAKYAMEAVGDARSANLLEQLGVIQQAITGDKAGFARSVANYMIRKSASKEKVGKKILEKSIKR